MAESPAHRLGQILGEVLEGAVGELLRPLAATFGLFLDRHGERPARAGKKVSWKDKYGNTHDLDYVLERGGSPENIGVPVAFIESAWRSYTKHSRAKAQEIQGAVLPIVDTHRLAAPFVGVVLAGLFTDGALTQLRSLGFEVLFFPAEAVVEAFATVGVGVAFEENTDLEMLTATVDALEALSPAQRRAVGQALFTKNKVLVEEFVAKLTSGITRQVSSIRILPLHGDEVEKLSVADAIGFLSGYAGNGAGPLQKVEVLVRFNNGNKIEGVFADKEAAVAFLTAFGNTAKPVID